MFIRHQIYESRVFSMNGTLLQRWKSQLIKNSVREGKYTYIHIVCTDQGSPRFVYKAYVIWFGCLLNLLLAVKALVIDADILHCPETVVTNPKKSIFRNYILHCVAWYGFEKVVYACDGMLYSNMTYEVFSSHCWSMFVDGFTHYDNMTVDFKTKHSLPVMFFTFW